MTSVRPETRPLLSLVPKGNRHGSRSHLTCFFRCGNACDKPEPNPTDHAHIQDEIAKAVGRRSILRGGAVGAGALVVGGVIADGGLAAAATGAPTRPGRPGRPGGATLATAEFSPVAPNRRDAFTTASGFDHDVVIRWGDPVVKGAPDFDVRRQSVEAAEKQFGYNCDYVGLLPLRRDEALLVVNHEYTDENLMFPAGAYSDDEVKRIAMTNHGMSVVRVRRGRTAGSWRRAGLGRAVENRRIHIRTTFELTGPAAGDVRLRTSADPTGRQVLGTLNNCAGGTTPWGTVLSGEENFNQYFDAGAGLNPAYAAEYQRYGISGSGRGWSSVDPRFDLSKEPHEPHRFGWIVEVDPYDPGSTPRKHTMLGRFKHEGANVSLARDGRAVAYMGDDERGDYLYKFVSADRFDPKPTARARRHNLTLLSKGTLYVARLTGDGAEDGEYDGTGTWIPLCSDSQSFVAGMSVADVLLFTRLAADKVAPTKMDRPEDVEANPVNGKVYAALTNNSRRGSASMPVDEANPLQASQVRASLGAPLTSASGNRNGYVLEMTPAGGDHAATEFGWSLFLVCGDPASPETWFGGFDRSKVSPISCPDNVAFDSEGNLWISTDGNVLGSNDGVFRVPVEGPSRGHVQQFCTVPKGAEACGPLITDGDRALWVAVQHPGEIDGSTFEEPGSTWPHTDAFPRPSVVVAYPAR
ncbi:MULTISPECIES: PhoX family protein [Nocardioides]|uniref:PhoX family protein n=1 Tax=Nocardioides vastitatis TaxID=2568655 RepID=A0ABW0ZMB1_9ACTN|nr:PhoX family phosphatase [Nocardioides sp.]THJ15501.1 PhoX family phosphatase [Nocardioides sp.]